MRKHPVIGAEIVSGISFVEEAKHIILHHHERYDGKGYPKGLKGEKIPIGASLVAVADAFDTMTTEHSYRTALTVDEAINELISGKGTQFCPIAVDTFVLAYNQENGRLVAKQTNHAVPDKTDLPADADKEIGEKQKNMSYTKTELFQGIIQLILPTVSSSKQFNLFKESLKRVDAIQVLMEAWSEDIGYEITISLNEPKPLTVMIKEMSVVEDVYKQLSLIHI